MSIDLDAATVVAAGCLVTATIGVGAAAFAARSLAWAGTAGATPTVATDRGTPERAGEDRRARLAVASGSAAEVLAALAAGEADPADPEVRRRCVLAAARLRRLIAESDDVPDPLLHELRAAADVAERKGVPVELVAVGVPPDLPVEVRRRLVDPLVAALADARDRARLTVVARPDEVVVGLVTPDHDGPEATGPPGGTAQHGPVELLQERDGEIRWTQTRWRRT
ncbi:hypothetical protein MRQ36_06870 [Micromonospora sp. R77]|nr:hypothetical protein [Micromonospora sp. R77]